MAIKTLGFSLDQRDEEIGTDVGLIMTAGPMSVGGLGLTGLSLLAPLAWQAANRSVHVPICISHTVIVKGFGWYNGGTAAGNMDVGLYDAFGNLISHTGSTVQAGTTTFQTAAVTAFTVQPGAYFLAMAMDGTTGTFQFFGPNNNVLFEGFGIQQATTNFPLAASPTLINTTNATIPSMGMLLHGSGAV